MEQKSSTHLSETVVRCPRCQQRIMGIQSGCKPFQSNAAEMIVRAKCSRCRQEVQIVLYNADN